jgi:hypothetical protein
MRIRLEGLLFLFVVSACATVPYSAHAQDTNAYLYIAHAASGRSISSTTNPGFPVDVSIGGHCVVQGETFSEIRGPFTLPAGSYAVNVTVADSINPCAGASAFSAGIALNAGSTSLGVIGVNSAQQVTGQIVPVNMGPVASGRVRAIVVNTTASSLTGVITQGDGTSSPLSADVPAATVSEITVVTGLWNLNFYPLGMFPPAPAVFGPTEFEVDSRSVYLMVLAGSTADNTLELIGPRAIRGVY